MRRYSLPILLIVCLILLTGCLAAQTITIASPANNSSVTSPVTVTASFSSGATQYMKIWADGVAQYSNNNQTSITYSLPLAAGSHQVVVQAYKGSKFYTATTNFVVQSTTITPTVTITSPAANSTVNSPFTVSATFNNGGTSQYMKLWADGVAQAIVNNQNTLSYSLSLAAGTHQLVVQAYNGTLYSATENVTVASPTPTPTPVSISLSPTSTTLAAGQSQQFTATVSGTTNTGVTWYVNGVQNGSSSVGTISTNGLYVAPTPVPSSGVTVTAASVADSSKTATAAVSFTASTPAPSPNDRYVSPSGSDSNDGTYGHPWLTLQHAANVVTAGLTVHVAPGTYTENNLTLNASGTSSARIRFISDQQWGAQIRVTSSYQALRVNGNYTDVVGFDVAGTTGSCLGIVAWGSYTKVMGNHIHDVPGTSTLCNSNGGAGVDFATDTASGNEVRGNLIHDIGMAAAPNEEIHGIYLQGTGAKAINNIVFHNSGFGITAYHTFTQIQIVNNTVFNNWSGGIVIASDASTVPSVSTVIANNISVFNKQMPGINDGYGIEMRASNYGGTGLVANNLVYGNAQSGNSFPSGVTVTGTVALNPQFVNYTGDVNGNYHLQATSPAKDAGTNQNAPSIDYDGGARPYGSFWDIGSCEFGATPATWPWF